MSGKPREYLYAGRLDEATRLEVQAKVVEKIIERELAILDLKPNMRVARACLAEKLRKLATSACASDIFSRVETLKCGEARSLTLR